MAWRPPSERSKSTCSDQTEWGGREGSSSSPSGSAGPRGCLPEAEMDGVGQDPGGSGPGVQPFNTGGDLWSRRESSLGLSLC